MLCSCPGSTKYLFIKIAVVKSQTKSTKSTCEVVSFYYICRLHIWNLLKTIFSQAFLNKRFAKITYDLALYGIVKNLIIYFAEAFRSFSHYQSTYHFSLFFLSSFWSSFFFPEAPSCGFFS